MARTRRALAVALVLSLVVHLSLTLWPDDPSLLPESTPLTATITELPPPPVPAAVPEPKPAAKPKPRRTSPLVPAAPEPVASADVPPSETAAPEAAPVVAEEAAPAEERAEVIPGAKATGKTLPPRVDLAYKVFWGTRGFLIGDAVYRFTSDKATQQTTSRRRRTHMRVALDRTAEAPATEPTWGPAGER